MMTGQDHRDAAEEERVRLAALPAAVPVAPVQAGPPSANALARLRAVYPYVIPWKGPYVAHGEAIEGRWLRGQILDADGLFTYEIAWKEGGPGAVVRREGKFRTPGGAREAGQWELERLEKLLTDE